MIAFAKPDDFKAKLSDGPVLALTKLLQPFHFPGCVIDWLYTDHWLNTIISPGFCDRRLSLSAVKLTETFLKHRERASQLIMLRITDISNPELIHKCIMVVENTFCTQWDFIIA